MTPSTPGQEAPAIPPAGGVAEPLTSPEPDTRAQRFDFAGTLREHAARGTLVNTAFLVGLSVLGLVRGFILAGFLTRGPTTACGAC